MNLPADIPAEAIPFLRDAGYLEPDRLQTGDIAPDVPLFTLDGEEVSLHRLRGDRPAVLIFGSYT
jgi:peroxiredoxin